MISVSKIKQLIEKAEEGPTLDYKEDLLLETDGDKAQFIKDVLSLSNSGGTAHLLIGVEDGTGKPVGFKTPHKVEQLNQILKDKCDPPLRLEYREIKVMGYKIGVIEINGEDPPYIVSVSDRFGSHLSANPQKEFYIERGTVFVRNHNMNEGAKRADLDRLHKVQYVTLQADLQLSHEVSIKPSDNLKEVDIKFFLTNVGEVIAANTYVWMQFKNVREIVQCKGMWRNISKLNENIPTVQIVLQVPLVRPIRNDCEGVAVKVDSDVEQIESRVIMGSTNMRSKDGTYAIPLKETNESK